MTINTAVRKQPIRRRGLTLIEVLASLTILGGAGVSMLLAQASAIDALHESALQIVAQRLARELKCSWDIDEVDQTTAASGAVEGYPEWKWVRSAETFLLTDAHAAIHVTLRMIHETQGYHQSIAWTREYHWLIDDE